MFFFYIFYNVEAFKQNFSLLVKKYFLGKSLCTCTRPVKVETYLKLNFYLLWRQTPNLYPSVKLYSLVRVDIIAWKIVRFSVFLETSLIITSQARSNVNNSLHSSNNVNYALTPSDIPEFIITDSSAVIVKCLRLKRDFNLAGSQQNYNEDLFEMEDQKLFQNLEWSTRD